MAHRRACEPHLGRAEIAENEGIVGERIDEDADPGDRGWQKSAALAPRRNCAAPRASSIGTNRVDDDVVVFVCQSPDFCDSCPETCITGSSNRHSPIPPTPAITASHRAIRTERLTERNDGARDPIALGNQRSDRTCPAQSMPTAPARTATLPAPEAPIALPPKPGDENHVHGIGQHLQQVGSRQRPRKARASARIFSMPPTGR